MLEPDRDAMFRALRSGLSDSDPSKPVTVPIKWNVVALAPSRPAKKKPRKKRARPEAGWWFR
jgi:hypothetical protein